jgi:predicted nucleic acid-binding protein
MPSTVVSNTTPLIHLAKMGKLNLLHYFFGRVAIPNAVYEECIDEKYEYEEVLEIKNADWLLRSSVSNKNLVTALQSDIDKGESETIALALEKNADLILLDDADARKIARLYHLKITGTIGILLRAKNEGQISSFHEAINQLQNTGFWIHENLKRQLLAEVGESKE